jgi:hypothetical protein
LKQFIAGEGKIIILLEGSQFSSPRPSDMGNMKVKTLDG